MSTLTDDSRPLLEVEAGLGDDSVVADRSETNYRALALGWVAIATLVRLVCLAPLPLGNGEAYYYSWSRFLDWSYYDHPPLIAWMVRLTTALGTSPAASVRSSLRARSASCSTGWPSDSSVRERPSSPSSSSLRSPSSLRPASS